MKLIMRLVATVALMLLSAATWAQLDYYTLVDSDNNPATGCAVTLPTSGAVTGIERRLTASVSETAAPQVTQLALESCVGGSFGAPATLPGAPYPVGSNNGTGGADAVELAVSVGAIAAPGATVRLYFAAQGPTSDDLLGATSGPPVLFDIQPGGGPADIPFLSGPGFLVLVLLLLGVVLWQRSRLPGSVVGLLLVGTLAGIAWAAGFRLDGQVDDWQGVSAVGSDAQGDSAPNTDIVAAFAAQEGGNLFFRTDIANAETTPSSNRAPSFTSTPVTAASVASPYSYAIASSDPDGNALTLTAPTLPAWLTFAPGANGAGTLTGTPGPADAGPHAVVLRVTDNGTPNLSANQTFTITVSAVPPSNQPPVIDLNGPATAGVDFAAVFTEDGGPVAIVDPANLAVTDPDSPNVVSATVTLTNLLDAGQETLAVDPATVAPNTPITAVYNGATGVLTLAGNAPLAQYQATLRTLAYDNVSANPNPAARTIASVVNDGALNSAPATTILAVTMVNDAPVANAQTVSTPENTAITITLTGSDPDNDTLAFAIATPPTNGTLGSITVLTASSASVTYTPNASFNGPDSFTFTVSDGTETSAPASVGVTISAVNDPPVVAAATFTIAENSANGTNVGTPVAFTDPDVGQTHTFSITGGNTGGAFAIDATTGQISVATSAALDFEAAPAFALTVQVTDNGAPPQSGSAVITIDLSNVNEAPVPTGGPFTIAENSAIGTVVGTVVPNDPDTGQTHAFSITGGNTGGAFAINSTTGQITVANSAALDFEATPSFGLAVQVTDNGAPVETGAATVTVNLTDVNEPPVANSQNVTTLEDTPVPITLTATDPENQSLTFISTTPSQGVLSGTAPNLAYTPNANISGSDSFTFTVSDGTNTSAQATVSITVTAVDDPPVAVNDAATVNEDSGANAINVLANDNDADGGPISITSVTQPANGAVVITGGGTGLTYAPNANYCNNPPGTTPDAFTYALTPGGSTATVTVTVTCLNDPPVADNDAFDFIGNTTLIVDLSAVATPAVLETTPSTFGVIDGDSDPEGDAIAVSAITVGACTDSSAPLDCSDPAVGRVQMQSNGRFIFDPAPGDTGATETFQYTLTDAGVPTPASVNATVTLTRFERVWYVNPVAPGGGNGSSVAPLNAFASINGAGGAGDPDFANDYIFVYFSGGTSLSGGIGLEDGQRLIGEHAGLSIPVNLNGNGVPTNLVAAAPGNRPNIVGTLTLNGNNVRVQGFNLSSGAGTGLNDAASAVSGVAVSEVSVTSTTGTAVSLSDLNGTVSLTAVSANGAASGIVLNNTTGSFAVTGNSAGLCGGGVSSATPPATAVAPDIADCTGGTIQNSTGPGMSLTNASNVSLTRMRIANGSDDGIRGIGVNGFTLASSLVESNGPVGSPTFYTNLDFGEDQLNGFTGNFVGLTGTASITNSTIRSGSSNNVLVRNRDTVARSLNLTVTGSVIAGDSTRVNMNDGILLDASQNASITGNVTGNVFSASKGDHFQAAASNNGNLDITFNNNTLTGGHSTALGQGVTINAATGVAFGGYTGTVDYDIDNNTINGAILSAITVNLGTSGAAGTFNGFVRNNDIGTTGTALSCSTQAHGIAVDAHGNGTHTVAVTGNTIRRCADFGMAVLANDGNGNLNLTVTGNTVTEMLDDNTLNGTPRDAINLNLGATSANVFGQIDSHAVCLALGGAGVLANSLTGGSFKNGDIRLRQRFRTSVVLPGYTPPGGNNFDTASVITFLLGNNTGGGTATATTNNDAAFTGEGYFGGAGCTLP